jgi:hypothetical protein
MTAHVSLPAATLLLLGALSSEAASACTCARVGSLTSQVKQAFQSESEVFSARVIRVDYSEDGRRAWAELEVVEVWKGSLLVGAHITVSVMPRVGGMSCALSASVGQELITYTSSSLGVSTCTTHWLFEEWGARERRLLDKLRSKQSRKSRRSPNTSLERTRGG